MTRRNIYDLIEEMNFDPSREYSNLISLMVSEWCYGVEDVSLYRHIAEDIFSKLPIRGTYVDLGSLLTGLGISLRCKDATLNELFNLVEFILCAHALEFDGEYNTIYGMIFNNIDIILEKTSHKIIDNGKGKIVVPKDAAVEEAASLAKNKKLSLEILSYNHRSNVGDLDSKREILNTLGTKYEEDLKNDKSELGNGIRFLLNNLSIRHNNEDSTKNETKYIKYIGDDLETWYDKLYALIVDFIISSKKEDILEEIKNLKVDCR